MYGLTECIINKQTNKQTNKSVRYIVTGQEVFNDKFKMKH